MTNRDIRSRFGETEEQCRWGFVRLVYQRVRRTIGMTCVPQSLGFDIWIARTEGEAHGYLYPLSLLDFPAWRNRLDVDISALCWEQPILRFEFRYISKYDPVRSGFTEFVRFERRSRSQTGYLVPNQMIEIDRVSVRARASRYVVVPGHWREVESPPEGFFFELSPAKTYLGTHLINDPFSGVWVIVYSEWTARFGAHVLWEVYDGYRLWFVPPKMRAMIP